LTGTSFKVKFVAFFWEDIKKRGDLLIQEKPPSKIVYFGGLNLIQFQSCYVLVDLAFIISKWIKQI